MSGHNLDRTLPPSDRDDAPDLPGLIDRPNNYPHPMDDKTGFGPHTEEEMGLTPAPHDDAPPLTDETDAARIARLGRFTAEGTKELLEALRLLAEGNQLGFGSAMRRCSQLQTEAAALSRILSRSFTARR